MHTHSSLIKKLTERIEKQGIENAGLTAAELTFIINYLVQSSSDENLDSDLLEKCTNQLYKIENEKIKDEEINAHLRKLKKKHKLKKIRLTLSKAVASVLVLFIIAFSMNLYGDAYGYNILNDISLWGKSVKNIPFNQQIDEGNISVIRKSVQSIKSFKKLLSVIDYPIQYLKYIPTDIKNKGIYLMDDEILFSYNNTDLHFSIKDINEIEPIIIDIAEHFIYKKSDFYIVDCHDTYSAYWLYDEKFYTLGYPDKDELKKMIKSLYVIE
ncbi:MAG: hypothetical protein AB9835_13295 [Eubacteriales bacterium]